MNDRYYSQESNASLQADEKEALASIYGGEWKSESIKQNIFSIEIGSSYSVHFEVNLLPSYPLFSPPLYQFSAPWMDRDMKLMLSAELEDIYCEHVGENIIHMWIEKIREIVSTYADQIELADTCKFNSSGRGMKSSAVYPAYATLKVIGNGMKIEVPPIQHGDPIEDRRSVFQAHVAPIVCMDQINQVLLKLKENRKIAGAKHNVVAYRIYCETRGTYYQDSDDDGENKAGSLLLHLLQILNVRDVVVIVTRWYGGILLGADRFKHYKTTARNLLSHCGYIEEKKSTSKKDKKRKKH